MQASTNVNHLRKMSIWHKTWPQVEKKGLWSCSLGDQLTGKGDQLTGGHGRHGWMGDIGYRGRGCVSLESEEKGKEVEVITDKQIDRQTDKWTEFPLVDSIPVRGRVKMCDIWSWNIFLHIGVNIVEPTFLLLPLWTFDLPTYSEENTQFQQFPSFYILKFGC